ncbi:MAG: DinB family protein [Dehalococcoidia bacterium]|nr:DinB family protein [Dehalococcoidia bacterium]
MDARVALLEQFAATPRMLAHLVAEADEALLDAAAVGEWSARTILAHLRDEEFLNMRVALERMLAEEQPRLHFLGPARWEGDRNRSRDRKELLLADFALQRQASLSLFLGLREEDWDRRGLAPDDAALTVAQLLEGWTAHDAAHVEQLERAVGETFAEVLERRARLAG